MLNITWPFIFQVEIKDFVDIFIVAFLIYQLLLIMHRTRAVQMLIGVLALTALFIASVHYQLYAINWILKHFFNSFLLIVIIIFQEEIRSALTSFGSGRKILGSFGKKEEIDVDINEIVEACWALSRKKIGGLIVIERGDVLYDFIETGTFLDSDTHADLIYSIFETKASLHDGAIIISKRKIKAAGCFLPLSSNYELDRSFGTRHRAALGLSELTDAIVVVVSEETGRISICIESEFYIVESETLLQQYLKHLCIHDHLDSSSLSILKNRGGM